MSRPTTRPLPTLITRAALAVVTGAALTVATGSVVASTALAAPALPAACSQSGTTVTCTYTAQGQSQFDVPAGITSVTATAVGAQGGADFGSGTPGGLGAVASGTLSVTPGQVLFVEVDVLGGAGGSVSSGFTDGGVGGGESDVRTCPTSGGQPCPAGSTLASRLVVAGGGGGTGDFGGPAGNAGTTGDGGNGASSGGKFDGGGGGGATESAPGTAGAACIGGDTGAPGAAGATGGGAGGAGGDSDSTDGTGGGGGGAGWYGGGGGGGCTEPNDAGGSGGGGTSDVATSVTGATFSQATAGEVASVTLVYTALAVTTTGLPGGTVGTPYSAALTAAAGTTPYSWTLANGSLPNGLSLSTDGTISGTPQAAGDVSFTVQVTDSSTPTAQVATEALAIDIGQAAPGVSLSASPASGATVASPVSLSATVVAVAGGPEPTGTVTFDVAGSTPAGCAGVSLLAGTASCAVGQLPAGSYTLGVSYSGDGNYFSGSDSITGYAVSKLTSAVTVSPDVAAPVWGQGVSFTAAVSAGGAPVTSGTVQWSVGGTPIGAPVQIGSDGTAPLGPLTDLAVGSDQVSAAYSGTSLDTPATGEDTIVVGKAATTTTVTVTSRRLTAVVAAVAPGAGQPSGTVTFAVNGTSVGTVNLSAKGIAVLSFRSSGAEVVSASYGGNGTFTGSSGSASTTNPVITARATSAHPKTRYGWYRSPVTITFTCLAGSAPLTAPCPGPVTLRRDGAAQSVTRTIHDTDGGIATVTVSPINIDRIPPVVRVTGIRAGATYEAPGPSLITCKASDSLSGLAGHCVLKVRRRPSRISWTATATDKAGNVTTVRGSARLADYYVAGVPRRHGFFQVTIGHSYMVKAYVVGAKAPRYVFAAPLGIRPHPVGPAMTRIGADLWAIEIGVTPRMSHYRYWTLGVLAGGYLHTIDIELHG